MRCLATAVAFLASLLALGSGAQAGMTICNDFRATIFAAFAYEDQGHFIAAGWWSAAPNACAPVDFAFPGATFDYAADSDKHQEGGKTVRYHWGDRANLFVTDAKFNFDHAESARASARAEMFSATAISQILVGNPYTVTIHFKQGGAEIDSGKAK